MENMEQSTLAEIFEQYPRKQSSLIMVLQDIQAHFNYLPQENIDQTADWLNVPRSQIYSVAYSSW